MRRKWCGWCGTEHPADAFYSYNGQLSAYCKEGQKAYQKLRYQADPEHTKTRNKLVREADPASYKLYMHQYYQDNKTVRQAYNRQYFLDNRELYYEAKARRRALLVDQVCDHEWCGIIDRRVVWGRDQGYCRIKLVCDGDFVPFEEMHLDHVVPLARGGLHCYGNVQTGCAPCNLSKKDKLLDELGLVRR